MRRQQQARRITSFDTIWVQQVEGVGVDDSKSRFFEYGRKSFACIIIAAKAWPNQASVYPLIRQDLGKRRVIDDKIRRSIGMRMRAEQFDVPCPRPH